MHKKKAPLEQSSLITRLRVKKTHANSELLSLVAARSPLSRDIPQEKNLSDLVTSILLLVTFRMIRGKTILRTEEYLWYFTFQHKSVGLVTRIPLGWWFSSVIIQDISGRRNSRRNNLAIADTNSCGFYCLFGFTSC